MGNPSTTEEKPQDLRDKQPAIGDPPVVVSKGFALRNMSRHTKRRIGTYLLLALAVPTLLYVLYVYILLHWSYSDGDRSGMLQKFSRKGWFCKTHEGELTILTTPGQLAVGPQLWAFTVRDEAVAKQVNAALGHKVVLHYAQHPSLPTTCFGETEYFVDGVRVIE